MDSLRAPSPPLRHPPPLEDSCAPAPPGHPWGPPGYQHPRGTTSLVLGLLAGTVCTPIGPFAWAMSRRALREVDAAPVVVTNRGQLVAGQALGVVATALLLLVVVTVVAAVVGVLVLGL